MMYNVFLNSNNETIKFCVDSENAGLSLTVGTLIALYEQSESPRLMSISIFPQIGEEEDIRDNSEIGL